MARRTLAIVLPALLLAVAPPAASARSADVAALQVALKAEGLYSGSIDGLRGPGTRRALLRFQRRHRLQADGVVGPRTRRALGRRGRPRLGTRVLRLGTRGWDVAALQFLLGRSGFPGGSVDGGFGARTDSALRRFQRWARVGADGLAGPATLSALRRGPPGAPVALRRPVSVRATSPFGPRGVRFHAGLDFSAAAGTTVRAARRGTVTWAGWREGGWGNLVSVAHGSGVRTIYAHLSAVHVRRGERVRGGASLGAVGATGTATGPHLHFELRLRGAALDPLPALR
jgi:murein DD-endopeptidase MepM/ murein hydrolase activator NlpD